MNLTQSLAIVSLLIAGCSTHRNTHNTKENNLELVKSFFQLTEKYSNDTSSFNSIVNYEQSRYVNQRSARDWNKLKSDIKSFYLDRIVTINYNILIDSLTFDTINHYVRTNTKYQDVNRIYKLTQKENIYKIVDSLFVAPLLVNRDEKFSKILEDDCNRFKEGKFELRESELFTFKIDRTKHSEHTYSDHDDDQWFSKIEWQSNNKYLEMNIDRGSPNTYYDSTYVNIYETTDTSYYFVSKRKNGNYYYEGFIVKIE
ncbi:MAG: hypothetical protein IPP15_01310 [Saprospiraceae bacterium]|uniref:Uncharacterized protein n=1 Tax=Candidatus Opimibacter skivensis TaxID=2982028 RepID=A0A9D7SS07_9BACT|nr:hypothetical protein [Candidatus Opimibacter skivensis]